eukprot:359163-Chlamydomonas_euryale.AAC.9
MYDSKYCHTKKATHTAHQLSVPLGSRRDHTRASQKGICYVVGMAELELSKPEPCSIYLRLSNLSSEGTTDDHPNHMKAIFVFPEPCVLSGTRGAFQLLREYGLPQAINTGDVCSQLALAVRKVEASQANTVLHVPPPALPPSTSRDVVHQDETG